MPSSRKTPARDRRASRGSSSRRAAPASAAKRGPAKPKKAEEAESAPALSSEDAAELEALTAPLRRYRAQTGEPKPAKAEPAASVERSGAAAAPKPKRRPEKAGVRDDRRQGGRRDRMGANQDSAAGGGRGSFGERGRRRLGAEPAARGGGREVGRGKWNAGAEAAAGGGGPRYTARSSLAQKGGPITTHGDAELASQLAEALAAADSDETNDLTHGFHTYPARMHPRLARELVARFSEPADVVLDPFCGSGTVLVEALVAGRKAQGVDLNPLALRISEAHLALKNPGARRRFERLLRHIADASEERVRSRARAHIPIDRELSTFYHAHVLFELSGLHEEIEAVPDEADRRALLIVFSSLLIKFSRRRADTSGDVVDKRIRKGLVTEFFERKGKELSMRWEALFEAVPDDAFEARLTCGDARELPRLLGADFRADLIVSSPPYGGTYDYALQHQLRNAWFGFDAERLSEREIGARSVLSRAPRAAERWDEELLAALRAMREVSSDHAHIVLWLGDAEIAGLRIPADEQVANLAPDAALVLKASAAQARMDARGGPDRSEHLLLLEPLPFPQRAGRMRD